MFKPIPRLASTNSVALYGYGREGASTETFLKKYYPEIIIDIWEDDDMGHPVVKNETSKSQLGDYDLIIKSPGISAYKPVLQGLEDKMTSNLQLWIDHNAAQENPSKVILVSGTKGKSTTVSALYHLFSQTDYSVQLLGNIGVAPLDGIFASEFTIIEASSYQLTGLSGRIDYGLFLNLYPEHVDWHQSHENYFRDKTQFFADQKPERIFINAENQNLNNYFDQKCNSFNTANTFHARKEGVFDSEGLILEASKLKLIGFHNLENFAGVLSVAQKALGASFTDEVISSLYDFNPLPHRLEKVGMFDGVTYINDSISTTPESTMAALKALVDSPIILIMGGYDRDQDYEELLCQLPSYNVKALFLLPQNGEKILKLAQALEIDLDLVLVEDLEEAFRRIQATVKFDDQVLLSPAAPSYGIFKNFEARGELFRQLVTARK